MIKSILAVAVVGAFSATAFAAMPSVDNGTGVADVTKINNNFTTLDNSKLDKSTYANNALLVNSKLAEKVDTATFNTKLNATASTLQGNIDTNKANIAANKEQIDLLTRVDNAQNQQIAGIQHKNNTQDNLIKGNTEAIKANANDIATNKTNIQTNANNIATNKANIQTNANNIAANRTLIEQYKASSDAQFKAVNSRIDSLDDKMKKGFASQAALNGLFQPYNVGKFNVSAAIGGYDSEQAMALGTGYRFNDNFAIKARAIA